MDRTGSDYEALGIENSGDAVINRIPAKHPVAAFGYACGQTRNLMPLPIWLAHPLVGLLDSKKVYKKLSYLLADGKCQVTMEYGAGKPKRIHGIILVPSQMTGDKPDLEQLRQDLTEHVIVPVCEEAKYEPDADTRVLVNPEGAPIGGGPACHSDLTGRKASVDTYGEHTRHSGAALSG